MVDLYILACRSINRRESGGIVNV